jgi:hypothetical protein
VGEVKYFESYGGSNSDLEPEKGRWIIDVESNATISTTKIQFGELDEP